MKIPVAETLTATKMLMERTHLSSKKTLEEALTKTPALLLWRVNGVGTWVLGDGSVVPIDPTINAGTAGVQSMFAPLYDRPGWEAAVSEGGLFATYNNLFGYPFDLAIEPLLPTGLHQPEMQLPFEEDVEWSFTGGPHGGWGDGSAWAALDFPAMERYTKEFLEQTRMG